MRPAVIMSASKLGMSEMMIMRTLANKKAMDKVMRIKASKRLSCKLAIKKLFPLIKIFVEPVTVPVIPVPSKNPSMRGSITVLTSESNLMEPMSAICKEMRIFWNVESANEFKSPLASVWPFM